MRQILLATFLSLPLIAQTPQPSPAPAPMPTPSPAVPTVGATAPGFRLNDHDGRLTAIGGGQSDGLWTVLAFYPKAATPG